MAPFSTLVLAAGKGTRMKSPLPKVLHRALGLSLLGHVLKAASQAGAMRHLVVVGHGREEVVAELGQLGHPFREVWQKEQKGTGHAAQEALPFFEAADDLVLIMNGDGPLLRAETLAAFVAAHRAAKADLTLGVLELEDPKGYGRVIEAKGALKKIVEEKNATAREKKGKLVNGGLYAVSRKLLAELLPRLKPNALTGEIYLTDIVALAAAKKKKLRTFLFAAEELAGVNDFAQLAEAEDALRKRRLAEWMSAGVRITAPDSFWADHAVEIEAGAKIGPNVVLEGNTRIAAGAVLEAGVVVIDSEVAAGARVLAYSHLEGARVKANAQVGPFARLRPGAEIGEEAKIGNFVEIKKSRLGRGAKVSHLSYVGDAEIGDETNLGCGFITCNYDGVNKHVTTVGKRAFVGSNVQAVAPVTIGDDAYVATGTVVTRDVPVDALAIARVKQENKEGYAARLRARMQAIKKNRPTAKTTEKPIAKK